MSIVISTDSPTAALPPAVPAPAANAGLPGVIGSADAAPLAGTPFDAALQAWLAAAPDPDMAAADAGADGDDPAAAPSPEQAPSPEARDMPAQLMALLPMLVQPAVTPDAAALAVGASPMQPQGLTMTADAAPVLPPASVSAGMDVGVGAAPAIALLLAAGRGALQPLPSPVRAEPVQPGVAADTAAEVAQPAATPLTATAGVAMPERPAAVAGVVGGDAGRQPPADGADRQVLAAALPVATADAGAPPRSPDAPLRLPNGDAGQWRQPLMQALGERLQFASERGIDSAVIRLEPPRMGSIEIAIRQQDGALQVNLSATHNEVLRQLQDISDSLRHSLGQRHAGDVSVQVADTVASRPGQGDGERQRQRQPQSEQAPGRGLGDAEADGGNQGFRLARNEE